MAVQTVEQIQRLAPFMEDYVRKLLESTYQQVQDPVSVPDQQVAGLTDAQKQAGTLIDQGIGAYQPLIDQSETFLKDAGAMLQDPDAYKEYMNPYERDVIDVVGEDIARQTAIERGILGGNAATMGALGGSRQGVAQAGIGAAGLREFGRQAAGLRESGFRTAQDLVGQRASGLGNLASGLGSLAVTGQNLGQTDISNLLGIGSLEQQQAQTILDADRANQIAQAYEPYQRLGFFSDMLRGVPTTQSTIGSTTTTDPSFLSQVAGTAATGLGLAGQLGYRPFEKYA